VGGGNTPRPGEISLAHQGVLFLDELPEFERRVLEVLREPLETGHITISRAAHQTDFPASFQLIAAMNPCPCGYRGHPLRACRCTPDQVERYQARISGPLLDRIDVQIEVPTPSQEELLDGPPGEPTVNVAERVAAAHARQLARQGKRNALLGGHEIDQHCSRTDAAD
ncbi:ATP-binding protein, partial [Maribellus luteus]